MPSSVASVLLVLGFLFVAAGAPVVGAVVGTLGAVFELVLFFAEGL